MLFLIRILLAPVARRITSRIANGKICLKFSIGLRTVARDSLSTSVKLVELVAGAYVVWKNMDW